MTASTSTLIVHGGLDNPLTDGVRRGLRLAWESGGPPGDPLKSVVEAVVRLEDDANFNAGTGSVLNAAGEVETDAAVVEPGGSGYAGVAALKGFRNPVRVAHALLLGRGPSLLVGDGAARFARDEGLEEADLVTPVQLDAVSGALPNVNPFTGLPPADTVGAVAIAGPDRVAVASSTGGILGKWPGRVGDAPVFGAGLYASPAVAVLASGRGEYALRSALSARIGMECEAGRPITDSVQAGLDAAGRQQIPIALLGVDVRRRMVVAGHTGALFPISIQGNVIGVLPETLFEMELSDLNSYRRGNGS